MLLNRKKISGLRILFPGLFRRGRKRFLKSKGGGKIEKLSNDFQRRENKGEEEKTKFGTLRKVTNLTGLEVEVTFKSHKKCTSCQNGGKGGGGKGKKS